MLESRGLPGATHMGTGFDAWYPGYIDYLPMLKNTAAFWTETALYRYATPHYYTLADFPRDKAALRSESLYPSPWKGGWWRLRDAVDYMLTASMADSGTIFSHIIPWNIHGALFAGTLGIAAMQWAPFTFFAYLTPVVSFVMVYFYYLHKNKISDKDDAEKVYGAEPTELPGSRQLA